MNAAAADTTDLAGLYKQGERRFQSLALSSSALEGYIWEPCEFFDCAFSGNFERWAPVGSRFERCEFQDADLASSNFEKSRFVGCRFVGSKFTHTVLVQCELENCVLDDCDLRDANLGRSRFTGGGFRNATKFERDFWNQELRATAEWHGAEIIEGPGWFTIPSEG